MKRTVFETAMVIGVLMLGLETVHYRNAVLESNADRNRAWRTVVQLRDFCEHNGLKPPEGEPPVTNFSHWP
jgi:hypothetical protein